MRFDRLLHICVAVLAILDGACSAPDRGSSAGSGGGSGLGGGAASGGTVGAGGSGGVVASGGSTSSGGTIASGGITGSGGATGIGGAPSSGGTTAQGGSAVGGGTTNSGGKSAAGGMDASGGRTGSGGTTVTTNGGAASGGAGPAGGAVAGSGGNTAAGGSSGSGGVTGVSGPCDIYQSGNTPCVAAHSTVRALYASYSGKLYQVRRASDKTTKDIPLLSAGGFVDASVQESFCSGTTCTISYIYDQSPQKNDLPLSPPVHWLANGGTEADTGPGKGQAKVGGHTVYGVYVQPDAAGKGGNTYRNNKATGLAKNDDPESMYMVVDGKYYNGRCCFDYGNVETDGNDDGNATMETLEFGNMTTWSGGTGNGPWILVDLENGAFAGGQTSGTVSSNTPIVANYVTGMVKGFSGDHYTIKAGDAQSGTTMSVKYDGVRPPGYKPMKKQGAVELGTGGDGSSGGCGIFFEGAITTGVSSDAIDNAVQANIVAAGYGK